MVFFRRGVPSGPENIANLLLGNLNLLAVWSLLVFIFSGLCKLSGQSSIKFLQIFFQALTTIYLMTLIAIAIFSWAYELSIGQVPNPIIIKFLFANFFQVIRHALQTMPITLLSLILISTLLYRIVRKLCTNFPINELPTFTPPTIVITLSLSSLLITGSAHFINIPISLFTISNYNLPAATNYSMREEEQWLNNNLPTRKEYTQLAVKNSFPVIMIQLESFRRDLSIFSPSPLPFLKSLEPYSLVLDRAYAPSSHSNLTDLAIWYSQYPLKGPGREGYPADADWRGTSLFAALKAAGYKTAYISSQNEKWGNMINWLKTPEIDYFSHSEDYKGNTWVNRDDKSGLWKMMQLGQATAGKVEDSKTLKLAYDWIAQNHADGPFFLGINLQNSHFSYVVPPDADAPFQPGTIDFEASYYSWPESKKEIVRNRYLNAVHYMDARLKDFALLLNKLDIWENCYFIVLGDSGEAFYEHGFGNHSGPMYEEVMRTFALIKPPKARSDIARLESRPINLIDVPAILLNELELDIPSTFQGSPLPKSGTTRPVFMYSNAVVQQYGIIEWPWKLLLTELPYSAKELYHLENDPSEKLNLINSNSVIAGTLLKRLRKWINQQLSYYGLSHLYQIRAAPRPERDLNR
jgi:arylsulfatase A-like enzyme